MKAILVTTTSDDRSELETIASELIENRLAACCQISGPVTSIYRWKDKVERSEEWSCTIKSFDSKFAAIESLINKHHHYETPEIIAQEFSHISASYLNWMENEMD